MRLKIEAGKRYVRRDEKITDPLVAAYYRGGLLDPKNQYYYIDGGDGTEGFCGTYMNLSYDLVSEYVEPKSEPSLQQLCDTYNAAANALVGHFTSLQYRGPVSKQWRDCSEGALVVMTFRPKPPSVFEPFTTSNGYAVKVEDGHLVVGCKRFYLSEALSILINFCSGTGLPMADVYNTRHGIGHKIEGHITWDEADRILKQLRQMQVGDK